MFAQANAVTGDLGGAPRAASHLAAVHRRGGRAGAAGPAEDLGLPEAAQRRAQPVFRGQGAAFRRREGEVPGSILRVQRAGAGAGRPGLRHRRGARLPRLARRRGEGGGDALREMTHGSTVSVEGISIRPF